MNQDGSLLEGTRDRIVAFGKINVNLKQALLRSQDGGKDREMTRKSNFKEKSEDACLLLCLYTGKHVPVEQGGH